MRRDGGRGGFDRGADANALLCGHVSGPRADALVACKDSVCSDRGHHPYPEHFMGKCGTSDCQLALSANADALGDLGGSNVEARNVRASVWIFPPEGQEAEGLCTVSAAGIWRLTETYVRYADGNPAREASLRARNRPETADSIL